MNEKPRKDRTITAILALIWFGAVIVVITTRDDFPLYLLGIGTVFFLMLLPSMKELVKNVDHYFSRNRHADD